MANVTDAIRHELCLLLHDITGDMYSVEEGVIKRGTWAVKAVPWTDEKAIRVLKGNCADYALIIGRALSFLQTHKLL